MLNSIGSWTWQTNDGGIAIINSKPTTNGNSLLNTFASHADHGAGRLGHPLEIDGDLTHYVSSKSETDAFRLVFSVPINLAEQ
jgi:hypothetical protein